MAKIFHNISEVAGSTMLSRVLGLIRDVLMFAALGTGMLNSAFIIAFTLPNLFRRLLGEGALTSSSIPVLSEVESNEGLPAAFGLLNGLLTRLLILLVALQFIAFPVFLLIRQLPSLPPRWYLGAELSFWLFPYVILICLSALICGMLQVIRNFRIPALNQVWLNLSMIVCLGAGMYATVGGSIGRVWWLTGGVLVGGLLQLWIPARALGRGGWKFRPSLSPHPLVDKTRDLFLPGLLGAAIFQVNILVSRMIAFSLDESAAGLLYLGSRLVELPLGVFAIAITTVLFPELSRHAAKHDETGYADIYRSGGRIIFIITLPAALGLITLAEPILRILFQWGLFNAADVQAAVPVLRASALGLPFFAWSTFLTRAYYAKQNMKIPVRLAAVNLIINLVLSLSLMIPLQATGLALAISLSSLIHCGLLRYFLQVEKQIPEWKTGGALILGNLLMVTLIVLPQLWGLEGLVTKTGSVIYVFSAIPAAIMVYFFVLYKCGIDEIYYWRKFVAR